MKIMVCEKHGEYQEEEIDYKSFGINFKTRCPECDRLMQEELDAKELKEKQEELNKKFIHSGIPERFIECTLENYRIENEGQKKAYTLVKEYRDKFDLGKVSEPLFLTGSFGTGKTHLAIGILKELIIAQKIIYGYYTTTMKMIRDIRGSYHHNSVNTEQEIIDKYVNTGLLIMDEVGLQNGTDNEKLLIYEVLNGRYENMKPTVIISNLPYGELTTYLGERVIDRLKGKDGILAIFNWKSERGNK